MSDQVRILTPRLMVPAGPDHNRIFRYYNPVLLTFPMKIILEAHDPAELLQATKTFLQSLGKYEILVIKSRSYIEYIPPKFIKIPVPPYLWEIVGHRTKYHLKRPANIAEAFRR